MSAQISLTRFRKGPKSHRPIRYDERKPNTRPKILCKDKVKGKDKRVIGFSSSIYKQDETTLAKLQQELIHLARSYRNGKRLPSNKDLRARIKANAPSFCQGLLGENYVKKVSLPFRRQSNVVSCSIIALDIDNNSEKRIIKKEELLRKLHDSGLEYLLYESLSSTPSRGKFRVIFTLSEPVSNTNTFKNLYLLFAMKFLGDELYKLTGFLDKRCNGPERVFYIGSKKQMERSIYKDGASIDVKSYLKDLECLMEKGSTTKVSASCKINSSASSINWHLRQRLFEEASKGIEKKSRLIIKKFPDLDYDSSKFLKELFCSPESQTEESWWASIREMLCFGLMGDKSFLLKVKAKIHELSSQHAEYNRQECTGKINRQLIWLRTSYQDFKKSGKHCTIFKKKDKLPENKLPDSDLHTARKIIYEESLKNFESEKLLLNSSGLGVGKTYTTSKAIVQFLETHPESRFLWVGSEYPALDTVYANLLEHGLKEDDIAFVPMPYGEETSRPSQFHCIKKRQLDKLRSLALNTNISLCSECKKRDTCPLHLIRDKAKKEDPKIIILHAAYLKTDFSKSFFEDRHVVMDEFMLPSLLGYEEIRLKQLRIFHRFLKEFKNEHQDEDMVKGLCHILKLSAYLIRKAREEPHYAVYRIPRKLSLTSLEPELLGKIKSSFSGEILKLLEQSKNPPKNFIDTLEQFHSTCLVQGSGLKSIFKSTPIKLNKIKSLSILDATLDEEITQKTLSLSGCNKELSFVSQHYEQDMAPVTKLVNSAYSKNYFKNSPPKKIEKLQQNMSKFIKDHGYEKVYVLSYKTSYKSGALKLSKLQGLIDKLQLTQLDKVYFGGHTVGHDLFGEDLKKLGIPKSKALVIIIGTPRLGAAPTVQLAYALKLFKQGDKVPLFSSTYTECDFYDDYSHEVKVLTYKDKEWAKLDMVQIQRQLLQAVGRCAPRGIATLIFSNMPLPSLKGERLELNRYIPKEQQKELEETDEVVRLLKKTINKSLEQGLNLKHKGKCLCRQLDKLHPELKINRDKYWRIIPMLIQEALAG